MRVNKDYSSLVYRPECARMMYELYQSGMSQKDIAIAFNVSFHFVYARILKSTELLMEQHRGSPQVTMVDEEISRLETKLDLLRTLKQNGLNYYGIAAQ